MTTPSIQTLITQAQQVLNLKSTNEIRATLAAVLANANVGTPLNPSLTTQQLWDEFYEIVRQPSDDIMSIVVDQMMRMVFSPPAPGGAGADKQVIFNDMGVLAGDAGLTYNKATDALTITGDLTVDTSTLKVDSTNDRVGIGTASPIAGSRLDVRSAIGTGTDIQSLTVIDTSPLAINNGGGLSMGYVFQAPSTVIGRAGYIKTIKENATDNNYASAMVFGVSANGVATAERMRIDSSGNVGVGVTPSAWSSLYKCVQLNGGSLSVYPSTDIYLSQNAYNSGGWKRVAAGYASQYIQTNSEHRFLIAGTSTADSAISFTQAMTLDASGRLGIGTATPTYKLDVSSATASNQLRISGSNQNTITFANAAAGASNGFLVGRSWASDDANNFFFYDITSAAIRLFIGGTGNVGIGTAGPSEALDVNSGNVKLGNGNVIIGTSGKGIDFTAVTGGTGTATGNVLNDYEEGTWTIGLKFGGGNTGLTTSSNAGRYTKVGRQVTVNGYLLLTNKGSSVGAAVINGLPFTIGSAPISYSAASLRLVAVSYTGAFQADGTSGTTITLEQISVLGAVTSLTDVNFANNSEIIVSLTYTV